MTESQGRSGWAGSAAAAWRSIAVAAVLLLPLAYPVLLAARSAARVMFGRDQGIYHFAAWAVSRGARDYVDICDINGPLTHGVHQLLLWLGGKDELAFRRLDLCFTGATFAFVSACLPGISRGPGEPAPRMLVRLSWAAAGGCVLGVQYLSYSYWDIGQREGFCDWLMLPSLGLVLASLGNAKVLEDSRRRTGTALGVAGALSVLSWFIKPSYVFASAVEVATLLAVGPSAGRKFGALTFLGGMAAGLGLELAWLGHFSSVPAALRAYFWEGPRLYAPIWHVGPAELLGRSGFPNWSGPSLLVGAVLAGLVARRFLPRRAMLLAALPVAATLHVLVQGKGFAYHYHLLTATAYLGGLGLVCALSERNVRILPRWPAAAPSFAAALTLLVLVALQLRTVPYLGARSEVLEGRSFDRPRPELGAHNFYMRFRPWDLAQGAEYVSRNTPPESRIFIYGTSPYLLFLARRDAATCDIYAYQLNVDAAIDGRSASRVYTPGTRLSQARAAELEAIRDRNARNMFAALRARPPAALVFTDDEAFLSVPDAWADFRAHNPEAARWMSEHFHETARFGTVRVWLSLH